MLQGLSSFLGHPFIFFVEGDLRNSVSNPQKEIINYNSEKCSMCVKNIQVKGGSEILGKKLIWLVFELLSNPL